MSDHFRPLVWVAILLIFSGAFFVFFAAHEPGASSIAETHGLLAPLLGVGAAILWLSEVNPAWLYFGVAFGCAAGLIDESNWVLGTAGLAQLAIARAIQVKFKL